MLNSPLNNDPERLELVVSTTGMGLLQYEEGVPGQQATALCISSTPCIFIKLKF